MKKLSEIVHYELDTGEENILMTFSREDDDWNLTLNVNPITTGVKKVDAAIELSQRLRRIANAIGREIETINLDGED